MSDIQKVELSTKLLFYYLDSVVDTDLSDTRKCCLVFFLLCGTGCTCCICNIAYICLRNSTILIVCALECTGYYRFYVVSTQEEVRLPKGMNVSNKTYPQSAQDNLVPSIVVLQLQVFFQLWNYFFQFIILNLLPIVFSYILYKLYGFGFPF